MLLQSLDSPTNLVLSSTCVFVRVAVIECVNRWCPVSSWSTRSLCLSSGQTPSAAAQLDVFRPTRSARSSRAACRSCWRRLKGCTNTPLIWKQLERTKLCSKQLPVGCRGYTSHVRFPPNTTKSICLLQRWWWVILVSDINVRHSETLKVLMSERGRDFICSPDTWHVLWPCTWITYCHVVLDWIEVSPGKLSGFYLQ